MFARDVMTRNICMVTPDTPVPAIARLLLQHRISAVPVVAADERIVGIVSEGDLMRRPEIGTERRRAWWLEMMLSRADLAGDFVKMNGRSARDVMTASVVTVGEDATVGEIAALLEEKRIKRVPVVRDGLVVGIASRSNLLQGLAASAGPERSLGQVRRRLLPTHRVGLREPFWSCLRAGRACQAGRWHRRRPTAPGRHGFRFRSAPPAARLTRRLG